MKKILIISALLITALSSFSQSLFGVWTPASGTNTYATNITGFSSNANKVIWVKFQNANTGASTITINSIISAVPIRKWSGSAWVVLSGGELDVNTIYQMKYSGSYYELEVFSASGGGAITDGSGTTANGTAVDFGGTQNSDAVVNGATGTYGTTFDEQEHFTVNVQGGNNANITVADGGDANITSNSGNINLTTFSGNGTQIVASGTGYAFSVTGAGILANVNSDATGDLLYRNSSGFLARRGIGSTGNVLTVSGGLPTWATASVAVGGITGLGTGAATALGINVGSAGSFVTNGGALGTPSSGVATNLTGTASGLTAGTVTTNANLSGDVSSSGNTTTYSGTVPINKGGSGQTTANTALNAFLPSQASANGKVLQSDGTNTSWQTPSAGFVNPMTSVGDIIQGSTAGAAVRLASVATGNALISGGVTTANSWGKITSSHIDATIQPTASPTFTGTVTFPTPWTLGATSVTSTGTQLNYLNAATGTTGTTSTNLVYSTSPTLVTPVLGTVAAGSILTNATGLPVSTGISGLGSNVATYLATPTTANLSATIGTQTANTGFFGPASGSAANATFRAQVVADLPFEEFITDATTSRTISATDRGKVIRFTSTSAITVTLPSGITSGFSCVLVKAAAGDITLTTSSSTLEGAATISGSVPSFGVLINRGSDIWITNGTGVASVTGLGTIDTQSKSSNGAVISGSSLYYQTADPTNPGLVSTTAQTFAGAKTIPRVIYGAGTTTAASAPIQFTSGTNMTTAEAGSIEYDGTKLYMTNAGAQRQELPQIQQSRVSTQFDATSTTTLANVTGLTSTLVAGKIYRFEATLYTTSNTLGGVKFAISGTATATAIIDEAVTCDGAVISSQTRATTMSTAIGGVTAVTNALCRITGLITVNAAGTLTVQFAQNASNGTASSILVGSNFVVTQMN